MRKSMTLLGMGLLGAGLVVSAANAEVVFKPASTSPTQGFSVLNTDEGDIFVAGQAAFTDADVTAAQAIRNGSAIQLTASGQVNGVERLAIFADGEFIGAPVVRATEGGITLTGLSRAASAHVANVIGNTGAGSNAAVISVEPNTTNVRPGSSFSVDVYIANVADLNTYQVRVNATSASVGALPVSDLYIDKDREDFVFGAGEVLDAVDNNGLRMGALMFNSQTIDTVDRLYLGTYTFDVPAGTHGRIYVNVEVGEESFLRNPLSRPIEFRLGQAGVVNLGGRTPARGK